MSIKSIRKSPSLLLSTSIGIILSRVKPTSRIFRLDISNKSNLVNWSIKSSWNSHLFIWSVDLGSKTLSDRARVSPNSLLLRVTVVGLSSVRWWKDTRSVLPVWVISVPPLPGVNISALTTFMSWWIAMAILSNACGSVL